MKFNQQQLRYVVILNNQDDYTTTPTRASVLITLPLLWRILRHILTWRIAAWLNKDLLNYELGFFDVSIDWLDAKCGCVGDCNCGRETPLGILGPQVVEERYEESSESDYIGGTTISIEGLWEMKLITFQKHNPSPYTSEMLYFKDMLTPFLSAWMK
jgi:hypothetical protein